MELVLEFEKVRLRVQKLVNLKASKLAFPLVLVLAHEKEKMKAFW